METMEALLERRSVRGYKPDPIPADVLEDILKAGTYAATGMGGPVPHHSGRHQQGGAG